jgi:hypothetical protein
MVVPVDDQQARSSSCMYAYVHAPLLLTHRFCRLTSTTAHCVSDLSTIRGFLYRENASFSFFSSFGERRTGDAVRTVRHAEQKDQLTVSIVFSLNMILALIHS